MKKHLKTIWPSIIWTAIIFVLLTIPTGSIEDAGMTDVIGMDKLVHFFLFCIFSFLWSVYLIFRARSSKIHTYFWYIVLSASMYGLGMEFYQKFFTTREFSILDAAFDSFGALAGMFWAKKSPYGNRGRNQN